jgi:hypothetical protein
VISIKVWLQISGRCFDLKNTLSTSEFHWKNHHHFEVGNETHEMLA